MKNRGLVYINGQLLVDLFKEGEIHARLTGMPKDAHIRSASWNVKKRAVVLFVESKELPEIGPENRKPTVIEVTVHQLQCQQPFELLDHPITYPGEDI
jgi:hypothetical protein